ncbi:hypothetical protein Tco_0494579 [Tanacetum coccineum]
MHEDYEYVKSLEKEVDELESEKADFSNIYDLLLEECVSKDVTCSYLHSLSDLNAYTELQSVIFIKSKNVNTEHSNNELKKLIENCKGKSVETQFNKPSVVRQPNAQRIPKPSVLGKPTPFSNSPEMRSSNDMVHNYYLEKAKKSAQLQKDKEVNGKPSMIHPVRLPNTANGTSFNGQKQPRIDPNADALYNENWKRSQSVVAEKLISKNQCKNGFTKDELHLMASAENNTSGPVTSMSKDV